MRGSKSIIAPPEIVAQYPTPPGGGKISPRQGGVTPVAPRAGFGEEVLTINGPDWTVNVTLIGTGGYCGVGPITFVNRGTELKSGGFRLTLANEAKENTCMRGCPARNVNLPRI